MRRGEEEEGGECRRGEERKGGGWRGEEMTDLETRGIRWTLNEEGKNMRKLLKKIGGRGRGVEGGKGKQY